MAGLEKKALADLLASLIDQGCRLQDVSKGVKVFFPNGSSDVYHRTESDWRGVLNHRARVLQAGLRWPFDGNRGRSKDEVTAMLEEALRGLYSASIASIIKQTGLSDPTIRGYFKRSGWKQTERRGVWVHPESEVNIYPEIEAAKELPKSEPDVITVGEREFIDTHNSEAIRLTTGVLDLSVRQLRAAYAAAGLRMEIRVWKIEEND